MARIGAMEHNGVLTDGVLYLGSGSGFLAVDARTGQELWRTQEYTGVAVIDGDGIILRTSTYSGSGYDLVRLKRSDGSLVWQTATEQSDPTLWSPIVADGVGYIPSGSGLLAFDPATGMERWQVALNAAVSRSPAVADGLAVVGDHEARFTVSRPPTGTSSGLSRPTQRRS